MPPITYSMSGMPALCAAFESFHVKSSVTNLVTVLVTVLVLPFRLTFTFLFSDTLTVSIFGVRSYSDQRYWSMQTSRHSLVVSSRLTLMFASASAVPAQSRIATLPHAEQPSSFKRIILP